MQKQNVRGEYRVGPGASSLLLIFVAVCLTTVGILTLISALADSRMNDRSTEYTRAYYGAVTRAQREIGVLDGQLKRAQQQARGDVFSYQMLVKNMPGDQIAMFLKQADDDAMSLVFNVPMGTDNHLEVELLIPMTMEGPRYEVVRQVAVNTADWVPDESLELFQDISLDDIMSGGEVEADDDIGDDPDTGFISEGQSLEMTDQG